MCLRDREDRALAATAWPSVLDNQTVAIKIVGNRVVGERVVSLAPAGSNWVDGDRFFDREVEVAQLRERVRDGIHTLITAQRRMGKTSLLRELLRRLDEEGEAETLFVDLEGATTAADAIAGIATAARAMPAHGRSSRPCWGRLLGASNPSKRSTCASSCAPRWMRATGSDEARRCLRPSRSRETESCLLSTNCPFLSPDC